MRCVEKCSKINSYLNQEKMANQNVFSLISFGFLVHMLILKAAFDVYFSSPIDHGMTPIESSHNPPAKRLVLFVADGLRAEAIFGNDQISVAPNLNAIRKTRGSWGISHTRVPTESRPGHVALLGGIYEDPSAILKGWKMNPVDFDSVINQSTNAWCWGGPSIINMFNKDHLPHIHLHSYHHSMEDFGNNNTIGLDSWVFEHVTDFVGEAMACEDCEEFKRSGNLFFLHLLGIDTAGHGFKPESKGYQDNIRFVDKNVLKMEELFERAFPDNSTAYVFTADHGMTNWGSHGAGSDHETKTPVIAWGAGITIDNNQKDVQQIDIAPMIAALIGINYPINSLGRLPVSYINTSLQNLNEMMISNVLQLVEIFNIKRYRRMRDAIRFVPFEGVTTHDLDEWISRLKNLSILQNFGLLKKEYENLMTFLIRGADYYHNYYQLPILIAITIGLVAWITYLATFNVSYRRTVSPIKWFNYRNLLIFGPMYLSAIFFISIQSLPIMYYIYFMFPIFMIQTISNRSRHVVEALRLVKSFGLVDALIHCAIYLLGFRLLVQGFRNRETLSLVMYIMGAFIFWSKALRVNTSKYQKIMWISSCIVLSFFPFLPVMKTTFSTSSYLFGFVVWWIAFQKFILPRLEDDSSNKFIDIQHLIFRLTPLYTLSVEYRLIGPESAIKHFASVWALIPIILIPFTSDRIYSRISSIFLGFGTFYLMVTSNYENIFLIYYVFILYAWIIIESKCFGYATITRKTFNHEVRENKMQNSDDFRRAFFFISLIFMGFFGTGNIASLNSFDPMWVRCFLTVFSPFKMSGLILLRVMVPFIFTSCVYRAVNLFRRGNTLNMFCIVLMFSDLMLLELLYYITNIGSWLEIGMSLSQFIIMEAFVIILLLLYGLGSLLTTTSFT